jgi:hypothetical protein
VLQLGGMHMACWPFHVLQYYIVCVCPGKSRGELAHVCMCAVIMHYFVL